MCLGGPARKLNQPKYRLSLLLFVGGLAVWHAWPREPLPRPLDRVPRQVDGGRLGYAHEQTTLHVSGSPEDMGTQQGKLLRKSVRRLLKVYVRELACQRDQAVLNDMLARVRTMKPALPDWYRQELAACAQAAGVDEDELLLAQCEGDIRHVDSPDQPPPAACSSYVVFGKPNIANGNMLAGRNLDYYGGELVEHCAVTSYYSPRESDGHPFVAVGFTGILGGATLVNSHGLVVANHLGGGPMADPQGVPSLVLNRMIAQTCATIDEGIELLRETPRMCGQIIWMAQPPGEGAGRPARAVAVEFDAADLCVREAGGGILIVSNVNHCFRREFQGHEDSARRDGVYATLLEGIRSHSVNSPRIITLTGKGDTLHSVEVDFEAKCLYVAHGRLPAHEGEFVRYGLP